MITFLKQEIPDSWGIVTAVAQSRHSAPEIGLYLLEVLFLDNFLTESLHGLGAEGHCVIFCGSLSEEVQLALLLVTEMSGGTRGKLCHRFGLTLGLDDIWELDELGLYAGLSEHLGLAFLFSPAPIELPVGELMLAWERVRHESADLDLQLGGRLPLPRWSGGAILG